MKYLTLEIQCHMHTVSSDYEITEQSGEPPSNPGLVMASYEHQVFAILMTPRMNL